MKNAIIIHGMPLKQMFYDETTASPSNYHWLPWLQKQLIIREIDTQTPEMPRPFEPDYIQWSKMFERFEITEDTLLIGHSGGAGFLCRWLSENKNIRVGQVVLTAPWLDLQRQRTGNFFDFSLDPDLVSRTKKVTVVYSDNDDEIILDSVRRIKNEIPCIHLKELHGLGHFSHWDMEKAEFPQLIEVLV